MLHPGLVPAPREGGLEVRKCPANGRESNQRCSKPASRHDAEKGGLVYPGEPAVLCQLPGREGPRLQLREGKAARIVEAGLSQTEIWSGSVRATSHQNNPSRHRVGSALCQDTGFFRERGEIRRYYLDTDG